MPEQPDLVEIHYRRLPDRVQLFRQIVVEETDAYVVTLLEAAEVPKPVTASGRTILEPGSPVVWFTYPGKWHDIGRFHRADGTFTGIYANVLTPVAMTGRRWETTDLCLDVWAGAEGGVEVLDEDELAHAQQSGWISHVAAGRARAEARALAQAALRGEWPPPEVRHWTLERARETVSRAAEARDAEPPE